MRSTNDLEETTNSVFLEQYINALGVDLKDKESKSQLPALLEMAAEQRNFEIENYWKRATYVWAFQAAACVLLGYLAKDGWYNGGGAILVPLFLAFTSAYVGFLTAQGSKFWQENWELHVQLLESALNRRLTHVVLYRGRPNTYSVSRVNSAFLCLLFLFWLGIFIGSLLHILLPDALSPLLTVILSCDVPTNFRYLAIFPIVLLVVFVLRFISERSKLSGDEFTELSQTPVKRGNTRSPLSFIKQGLLRNPD